MVLSSFFPSSDHSHEADYFVAMVCLYCHNPPNSDMNGWLIPHRREFVEGWWSVLACSLVVVGGLESDIWCATYCTLDRRRFRLGMITMLLAFSASCVFKKKKILYGFILLPRSNLDRTPTWTTGSFICAQTYDCTRGRTDTKYFVHPSGK